MQFNKDIPSYILSLAQEDVKLHGLKDRSVKKEDKHPAVLQFIQDTWKEIDSQKDLSGKDKDVAIESVLKQLYPAEHNGQPLLKQNSSLRQLFASKGLV